MFDGVGDDGDDNGDGVGWVMMMMISTSSLSMMSLEATRTSLDPEKHFVTFDSQLEFICVEMEFVSIETVMMNDHNCSFFSICNT